MVGVGGYSHKQGCTCADRERVPFWQTIYIREGRGLKACTRGAMLSLFHKWTREGMIFQGICAKDRMMTTKTLFKTTFLVPPAIAPIIWNEIGKGASIYNLPVSIQSIEAIDGWGGGPKKVKI